jgi:hypothetical protein
LDVGGIFGHRLSPIYYTSITEIKGFRLQGSSAKESKTPSNNRNHFLCISARSCELLRHFTARNF